MTSDPELQPILQRLNEAKVLILGEVWYEQHLVGEVARAGAESLEVRPSQRVVRPGGAGGVACAAAGMGARALVASALGRDAQGGEVLRALGAARVDAFAVVSDANHSTGERLILTMDGERARMPLQLHLELAPAAPLAGVVAQEMLGHVEAVIGQMGAVVLVAGPGVPEATTNRLAQLARDRGKPLLAGIVCATPDGCDECTLPACDMAVLWITDGQDEGAGDDLARRLLAKTPHKAVVVFSSAAGARLYRADAADAEIIVEAQAVAGTDWETFMAGAACATALGADALLAARTAVAAALSAPGDTTAG